MKATIIPWYWLTRLASGVDNMNGLDSLVLFDNQRRASKVWINKLDQDKVLNLAWQSTW